jgi:hypothetical protein
MDVSLGFSLNADIIKSKKFSEPELKRIFLYFLRKSVRYSRISTEAGPGRGKRISSEFYCL